MKQINLIKNISTYFAKKKNRKSTVVLQTNEFRKLQFAGVQFLYLHIVKESLNANEEFYADEFHLR